MQGFDVHMCVFFYVLTLDVLYATFLCRTKARYVVYIYVIKYDKLAIVTRISFSLSLFFKGIYRFLSGKRWVFPCHGSTECMSLFKCIV